MLHNTHLYYKMDLFTAAVLAGNCKIETGVAGLTAVEMTFVFQQG